MRERFSHVPYPTIDMLTSIIVSNGPGTMFKTDLSRAYKQLFVDPGDIHLFWL